MMDCFLHFHHLDFEAKNLRESLDWYLNDVDDESLWKIFKHEFQTGWMIRIFSKVFK